MYSKYVVSLFLCFILFTTCAISFGIEEDLLGKYEVLRSDDFELGVSTTYTLFRDARSSRTYHVHPSSVSGLSGIKSGTPVRVRGSIQTRHEAKGLVTHGDIHIREFQAIASAPEQNNTAMVFRRMVMLLINLGKYNLECTTESMQKLVNGADGWYNGLIGLTERNTGGVITYSNDLFGGAYDIVGPFNVDYDGTCNADAWATQALDEARLQGIDISAYQNRVFALPGVGELYSTCGWHGLGNVGCDVCNAWVADCTTVEVFLHELGHNLGLPHAGSDWNQQGNLVEYGDPTSVMGNEWWSTNKDVTWYNLPEMDYLMNGAIDVVQVEESGDFQIVGFDILPLNVDYPQGIKVKHPDTGHLFYFSFHANETVFFANEIVVHEYYTQSTTCYIIRSLPLGEIFTDKLNRITVSPVYFDGTVYTLQVRYGCVVEPTYFSLIMHAKSANYDVTDVAALPFSEGETASFTLKIYNLDAPLCTPTTYNFTSKSIGSWPVTFSPSTLYLVPGQNCTVEITMQIPATATAGSHPVNIFGAASSGFAPSDHDIELNLNVTIGKLECIRTAPTLYLSLPDYTGTQVNYNLIIINNDGFGCSATDFALSVTLPSEFSWNDKTKTVSVGVGETQDVLLSFTLLRDGYNKSFIVNVTSAYHVASVTEDLPPMTTSPCHSHSPLIQVMGQDLNMSIRSADSVLVSVTNRDTIACEGSNFLFSLLDELPSSVARITLYPASMFLLPGQVGYFYMLVAVPFYQQATSISIPVGAERVLEKNYFDSTSYLALNVYSPPCELASVDAASWCQNDGNLADGWIQCAGLLQDQDSWTCPNINLRIHAQLPPGWIADFQQGPIQQYNAGNSTWYWVNMTIPSNLTGYAFTYAFYGGEIQNETLHSFYTSYTVYTCNSTALKIIPASDDTPVVSLGQTVKKSLTIRNGNTVFCTGLLVIMAAEFPKDMPKGLITVGFSRNTFALAHETDAKVDVSITANLTGILPVGNSSLRTYSFNLTATDKKNATLYLTKLAVNVTVNLSCALYPPLISFSPALTPLITPGAGAEATYTVSITNKDSPLCQPTNFYATFDASNSLYSPSTVSAVLAPNETFTTNVTFGNIDNTPPGVYTVATSTNDGASASHIVIAKSNYTVSCPVPRPIFNLTAVQFTPFLHTKTAVQLLWNACENPLWCCCPCTWEVYRDGVKIAVSSTSNYTDFDRPAGSSNNYTAITIDKSGVRSPTTTTCTVSVDVSVQRPDLTKLYFFIGIVFASAMWLFGCGVLLYMFRKSLQDRINRTPEETALLLSENGESKDEQEDEEERSQIWTEADSRVSSDAEPEDNQDL